MNEFFSTWKCPPLTIAPTSSPISPTAAPTQTPTQSPTASPTQSPTQSPTASPTQTPCPSVCERCRGGMCNTFTSSCAVVGVTGESQPILTAAMAETLGAYGPNENNLFLTENGGYLPAGQYPGVVDPQNAPVSYPNPPPNVSTAWVVGDGIYVDDTILTNFMNAFNNSQYSNNNVVIFQFLPQRGQVNFFFYNITGIDYNNHICLPRDETFQVTVWQSLSTNLPSTKPTVDCATSCPITLAPTTSPTTSPTAATTTAPTAAPTVAPTAAPTTAPTTAPTAAPTPTPIIGPDCLGNGSENISQVTYIPNVVWTSDIVDTFTLEAKVFIRYINEKKCLLFVGDPDAKFWVLYLNPDNTLSFETDNRSETFSTNTITLNTFFDLRMVWDFTSLNRNYRIYVNDILFITLNMTASGTWEPKDWTQSLYVGSDPGNVPNMDFNPGQFQLSFNYPACPTTAPAGVYVQEYNSTNCYSQDGQCDKINPTFPTAVPNYVYPPGNSGKLCIAYSNTFCIPGVFINDTVGITFEFALDKINIPVGTTPISQIKIDTTFNLNDGESISYKAYLNGYPTGGGLYLGTINVANTGPIVNDVSGSIIYEGTPPVFNYGSGNNTLYFIRENPADFTTKILYLKITITTSAQSPNPCILYNTNICDQNLFLYNGSDMLQFDPLGGQVKTNSPSKISPFVLWKAMRLPSGNLQLINSYTNYKLFIRKSDNKASAINTQYPLDNEVYDEFKFEETQQSITDDQKKYIYIKVFTNGCSGCTSAGYLSVSGNIITIVSSPDDATTWSIEVGYITLPNRSCGGDDVYIVDNNNQYYPTGCTSKQDNKCSYIENVCDPNDFNPASGCTDSIECETICFSDFACSGYEYKDGKCHFKSGALYANTPESGTTCYKQENYEPPFYFSYQGHKCNTNDPDSYAWIVEENSSYFPSGCSGSDLVDGKCRYMTTENPEECKPVCDSSEECTGFRWMDGNCYFRTGEINTIVEPKSICYSKNNQLSSYKVIENIKVGGGNSPVVPKGDPMFPEECSETGTWSGYYDPVTEKCGISVGGTVEQCQKWCNSSPDCDAIYYTASNERCIYRKHNGSLASDTSGDSYLRIDPNYTDFDLYRDDNIKGSGTDEGKNYMIPSDSPYYPTGCTDEKNGKCSYIDYGSNRDTCDMLCSQDKDCTGYLYESNGDTLCHFKTGELIHEYKARNPSDNITMTAVKANIIWDSAFPYINIKDISLNTSVTSELVDGLEGSYYACTGATCSNLTQGVPNDQGFLESNGSVIYRNTQGATIMKSPSSSTVFDIFMPGVVPLQKENERRVGFISMTSVANPSLSLYIPTQSGVPPDATSIPQVTITFNNGFTFDQEPEIRNYGSVNIKNVATNQCLTDNNTSSNFTTELKLAPCSTTDNSQIFSTTDHGNDYDHKQIVDKDGHCVILASNSRVSYCNYPDTIWQFEEVDNNTYVLNNTLYPENCMSVENGIAIPATCDYKDTKQHWYFDETPIAAQSWIEIKNKSTNKCMEVTNPTSGYLPEAWVVYPCDNDTYNQRFNTFPNFSLANDVHTIKTTGSKCMFVSTDGRRGVTTCNDSYRDQSFYLDKVDTNPDTYVIKNYASNQCLEDTGNSISGNLMGMGECNYKDPKQQWIFS